MKKPTAGGDPDLLTFCRRTLFDQRNQALAELGVRPDTLAAMGRVAEDDQAPIVHDEFVSLRLNSLGHSQLRLVEEALDRLEAGDYGTCQYCEEPIPVKRLRALPWARYCVRCQESLDAGPDFKADEAPWARTLSPD